jgi:hypothetical protein
LSDRRAIVDVILDFGVQTHRHRSFVNYFPGAIADYRDAEAFFGIVVCDHLDDPRTVADGACTREK